MAKDTPKTGSQSLNDKDIETFARRAGPQTGGAGTDVDTHSDSDAPATDHDTAPVTDSDA